MPRRKKTYNEKMKDLANLHKTYGQYMTANEKKHISYSYWTPARIAALEKRAYKQVFKKEINEAYKKAQQNATTWNRIQEQVNRANSQRQVKMTTKQYFTENLLSKYRQIVGESENKLSKGSMKKASREMVNDFLRTVQERQDAYTLSVIKTLLSPHLNQSLNLVGIDYKTRQVDVNGRIYSIPYRDILSHVTWDGHDDFYLGDPDSGCPILHFHREHSLDWEYYYE